MTNPSAQIRTVLVESLHLDLIGPTPDDPTYTNELLPQAPSKWYLSGFLVPFGAPADPAQRHRPTPGP
jgi:hypothetical protein